MANDNDEFFTKERLRSIGLGIGRGFQSFDPENPFAGAGAAMETTIAAEMAQEDRTRTRSERLADLAMIEEKQKEAERRSEERQKEAERRSEERQKEAENRAEQRQKDAEAREEAASRRLRQDQLDWYRSMDVEAISKGLRSESNGRDKQSLAAFVRDFADIMGGSGRRIPGLAPIDPYEGIASLEMAGRQRGKAGGYSMEQDKPQRLSRGMMRTDDGRMVKAVEDKDQETPIYGDRGRSYAY